MIMFDVHQLRHVMDDVISVAFASTSVVAQTEHAHNNSRECASSLTAPRLFLLEPDVQVPLDLAHLSSLNALTFANSYTL